MLSFWFWGHGVLQVWIMGTTPPKSTVEPGNVFGHLMKQKSFSANAKCIPSTKVMVVLPSLWRTVLHARGVFFMLAGPSAYHMGDLGNTEGLWKRKTLNKVYLITLLNTTINHLQVYKFGWLNPFQEKLCRRMFKKVCERETYRIFTPSCLSSHEGDWDHYCYLMPSTLLCSSLTNIPKFYLDHIYQATNTCLHIILQKYFVYNFLCYIFF